MTASSWTEICVSDFEQSINWFENVLGFRVVARDVNEYAELSRGETSIQLATDNAPYWESEHSRLLPPGQRGSGVEIILLVENVDAVYRQAQEAQADIVRELADTPWHMRQFWVRHPDGYLIRPAQKILSVNPATYRRQIADAFGRDRRDGRNITKTLATVKETADALALQQDYLGAVMIYETLVTEIFEQCYLSYNEAYEYNKEEPYYEEGFGEFAGECAEVLGTYLADKQPDRVERKKIITVLLNLYQRDPYALYADKASIQLIRYTTSLERGTIADWIRDRLTDKDTPHQAYGKFLLDLEKETLSDEAYLQICRETGRISDLIDRLLALGRVDEAERETQPVNDSTLLQLADLFTQHKQDAIAERLVKARVKEQPYIPVLEWLQKYYHARGNHAAGLEVTELLISAQPLLKHYQELRDLAKQVGRWESLRSELLVRVTRLHEQWKSVSHWDGTHRSELVEALDQNTSLLVQIALDEGEIDKALQLLQEIEIKDKKYKSPFHRQFWISRLYRTLCPDVARAAEETRPYEALQLYQQFVEQLVINDIDRNCQQACTYLTNMSELYQKLGEYGEWMSYIAEFRQKNRDKYILQRLLAKAGL